MGGKSNIMKIIFRLFFGLSILALIIFTVNVGFAKMETGELGRAEILFSKLESTKGYTFIRNSKEISSKELADLLRIKLACMRSRVSSVEGFISEEVVAKNGYGMRKKFSQDRENLAEYLKGLLIEIDQNIIKY